jgi:hypothetical protein
MASGISSGIDYVRLRFERLFSPSLYTILPWSRSHNEIVTPPGGAAHENAGESDRTGCTGFEFVRAGPETSSFAPVGLILEARLSSPGEATTTKAMRRV